MKVFAPFQVSVCPSLAWEHGCVRLKTRSPGNKSRKSSINEIERQNVHLIIVKIQTLFSKRRFQINTEIYFRNDLRWTFEFVIVSVQFFVILLNRYDVCNWINTHVLTQERDFIIVLIQNRHIMPTRNINFTFLTLIPFL